MTTLEITQHDGAHGPYSTYLWGGVPIGLDHDAKGWWGVTTFTECYPTAQDALAAMQKHWEVRAAQYTRRTPGKEYAQGRALVYQVIASLFPEEVKA